MCPTGPLLGVGVMEFEFDGVVGLVGLQHDVVWVTGPDQVVIAGGDVGQVDPLVGELGAAVGGEPGLGSGLQDLVIGDRVIGDRVIAESEIAVIVAAS